MSEAFVEIFESESGIAVNKELVEFIKQLPEKAFSKRSHYFHGRYENLYIDEDSHPGLSIILDQARTRAGEILQRTAESLKVGFWLNIMQQGDVTTLHSHDDDDELLSAVYYLSVPEGSGVFRLHHNGEVHEIEPVAGRFMFFEPSLLHEVASHNSSEPRISIGFNFGPLSSE